MQTAQGLAFLTMGSPGEYLYSLFAHSYVMFCGFWRPILPGCYRSCLLLSLQVVLCTVSSTLSGRYLTSHSTAVSSFQDLEAFPFSLLGPNRLRPCWSWHKPHFRPTTKSARWSVCILVGWQCGLLECRRTNVEDTWISAFAIMMHYAFNSIFRQCICVVIHHRLQVSLCNWCRHFVIFVAWLVLGLVVILYKDMQKVFLLVFLFSSCCLIFVSSWHAGQSSTSCSVNECSFDVHSFNVIAVATRSAHVCSAPLRVCLPYSWAASLRLLCVYNVLLQCVPWIYGCVILDQ